MSEFKDAMRDDRDGWSSEARTVYRAVRQYMIERTDNDGKTWHQVTRWAEGCPYMEVAEPEEDERILEREVTDERIIYDRGRWMEE